jgi:hypothetical protein
MCCRAAAVANIAITPRPEMCRSRGWWPCAVSSAGPRDSRSVRPTADGPLLADALPSPRLRTVGSAWRGAGRSSDIESPRGGGLLLTRVQNPGVTPTPTA